MQYRPFAPEDFEQLYAIEKACFAPPLRFDRRYMRSLVRRKTGAVWIAEEDGRMAGFAIVEWNRRRQGLQAYIQTLEVAPGARGQGGEALLAGSMDFGQILHAQPAAAQAGGEPEGAGGGHEGPAARRRGDRLPRARSRNQKDRAQACGI